MTRCLPLLALLAGLLLACAGEATASPSYLGLDITRYVGGIVDEIATSDLNGDGRADLVVAAAGPDGTHRLLSTYLASGDGSLAPGPTLYLAYTVSTMVIADIVGDGAPDLAYATDIGPYTLHIHPGLGDGGFGPEAQGTPALVPTYLRTADLDGDQRPDLLVATENGLVILRGTAGAAPAVDRTLAYPVHRGIASGDLDGDGDLDLVLASHGLSNLSVLRNDGNLNFSLQSSFADDPNTNTRRQIVLADLAGNGMPSLVITDPGSFTTPMTNVRVAPRTGTFTFGPSVGYASGGRPWDLVTGDWNLDGRTDVAVGHQDGGVISLFSGRADGGLDVRRDLVTVRRPETIATADLDGDGRADLATGSGLGGFGRVAVLPGTGFGSFGSEPVALPSRPRRGVVADVNADGHPDFVVARASGAISILPGDGSGALGSPQSIDVGTLASAVVAGDFDGDGYADLATANTSNSTVSVLRGTGPGLFGSPVVHPVGLFPLDIRLHEVTGDGFPDLVTLNDGNSMSILPGLAGGVFAPRIDVPFNASSGPPRGLEFGDVDEDGRDDITTVLRGSRALVVVHPRAIGFEVEIVGGVGERPTGVAVFDADRDGHLDIAVSSETEALVRVLRGTGGGAFAPAASYPAPGLPGELSAGDWNGDGLADLVCLDAAPLPGGGTLVFLPGDGAGHFAVSLITGVDREPYGIARGDLDGDGRPDFIVTSEAANSANVLLNHVEGPIVGVAPPPAGAGLHLRFVSRMPARGEFQLAFEAPTTDVGVLRVLSARGAVVFQERILPDAAGAQLLRVAPTGLRAGVYWAEVRQGAYRGVVKFVFVP